MFSRLQPVDASVAAARELRETDPDLDVLGYLAGVAEQLEKVVPDCVGLSVAWLDLDLAFTLVASDLEVASLDAVQYLDGGPCVEPVPDDAGRDPSEVRATTPLDEDRWQLFSRAAAARGVRSTLTVPLVEADRVVGTVNLYGATPDAFDGRHEAVAAIVGGHAADVVRNADLSFTTLAAAEQAPATLEAQRMIAHASGILAARMDVGVDDAVEALEQAALRAGVRVEDVARLVVESHQEDPGAGG